MKITQFEFYVFYWTFFYYNLIDFFFVLYFILYTTHYYIYFSSLKIKEKINFCLKKTYFNCLIKIRFEGREAIQHAALRDLFLELFLNVIFSNHFCRVLDIEDGLIS